MIPGIVSPVCDAITGVIPGPQWLDALASLSPGRPLAIRAGISAGPDDVIREDAIVKGTLAYRQRGHQVIFVLEEGMSNYHLLPGNTGKANLLPNAVLGLDGNPFQNDWIVRSRDATQGLFTRLAREGALPDGVIIGNEPNLEGVSLNPGDLVLTAKGSSRAPQVYAGELVQLGGMVAKYFPTIQYIWPAGFSQLVKFFAGVAGNSPWFQQYWNDIHATLQAHGVPQPYPWQGLNVHLEGDISKQFAGKTDTYADYVFSSLTEIKTLLKIPGPSIAGEWGVPAGVLDPIRMTASYRKLQQYAYLAFFFQAGCLKPSDPLDYGCWTWTVSNGYFVPMRMTPWVPLLTQLFAS